MTRAFTGPIQHLIKGERRALHTRVKMCTFLRRKGPQKMIFERCLYFHSSEHWGTSQSRRALHTRVEDVHVLRRKGPQKKAIFEAVLVLPRC